MLKKQDYRIVTGIGYPCWQYSNSSHLAAGAFNVPCACTRWQ